MTKSTPRKLLVTRRQTLIGAAAALTAGAVPGARAQAKLAPPNIIKPGTLVMSTNPTLRPLQWVNDRGELQGMRIELGNEIGKQLGLTPEYIRIEFAAQVPGLAAKRWDMINTGIFWTEERSKLMYMVPYERAALSFMVARNNPLGIKAVSDLAGRRVSVELGGVEERRTREVSQQLQSQNQAPLDIRTFNNFAEAFQALRAGQVDASVTLDATAQALQEAGDFTRGIAGLFPQIVCIAFANKPLADAVVGTLNDLKKSGYYDALFDRYGVLKHDSASFSILGPGPA
jgi:polar amino acid transport system substrate-binding protein